MDEEQRRQYWNQQAQQHAYQQYQEAMSQQADDRFEAGRANLRHQISQQDINNRPQRKYSLIVAVDLHGAFSKDGKIPWYYKDDFEWFKRRTVGQVCVMGRATYDDINERLGDKAAVSVLPDRECYVVTSTPLPRNNATAIARIADLDVLLGPAEADSKTVFFCGGERIYREGIAYCDQLLITYVNKEVEGDKFIPRQYILDNFVSTQVFKGQETEDLRFVVYQRKMS